MANYKSIDLYGGAMKVDLPVNFGDVSQIRQVPDTQEVFLDKEGFTSIVFDILERVEKDSDLEALKYHFEDIAEDEIDDDKSKIQSTDAVIFSKLPPQTPAYTLHATQPPPPQKGRSQATTTATNAEASTAILIALIRLVDQKTDIVISINVPPPPPQEQQQYSKDDSAKLLNLAIQHRDKIMATFDIKDWDLFVQDE